MLYTHLLRPALFRIGGGDAERAHEFTLGALAALGRAIWLVPLARRIAGADAPGLARTLFGVRFPGPLGLAAGMDKDGVALAAWAGLGFSHIEVGTVTWQAQAGNPRPRLFRLPQHGALINRMGFNNAGAAALAARLAAAPGLPVPIGVSLGKSRATPVERAADDYCASLQALYGYGSYFAVNVSSPNTPGLRELQDRAQLGGLLAALQAENRRLAQARGAAPKPLLVKIAPDLSEPAIGELLNVCAAHGVSGLIATNTTLDRAGVAGHPLAAEAGGLSGRPLAERAVQVVRFVRRQAGPGLAIIGVGGIFGPDDALRMREAGADLLQVYSGLIYAGPGMVGRVNRAMADRR